MRRLRSARFIASRDGSSLIEFAMLAPVFFLMVAGLVDFVYYQYRMNALNYVVSQAARNLQTGQSQNQSVKTTAAAFNDAVCAAASTLIDCNAIRFDVRAYDKISDIQFSAPTYDKDGNPTNFVFLPGTTSQYTTVRAQLKHTFLTPFMDQLFKFGPTNSGLITAFYVVKDEPW